MNKDNAQTTYPIADGVKMDNPLVTALVIVQGGEFKPGSAAGVGYLQ